MRLVLLGCYGPYPPAGGACSGYLLQAEGCSVLLDCGNGVLSRLQQHLDFNRLDAILLSHLHADHYSDIMIMRYGLEIAVKEGVRPGPLPLYAPAEPVSEFERLPYKSAYHVRAIIPGEKLQLGAFCVNFTVGVHAVPSMVMRIEAGSKSLVYSGDTEYFSGLEEFASGADLFLCEANYLQSQVDQGLPNHLSAAQAGRAAAAAGVKKLLLTHHNPAGNPEAALSEARKEYPAALLAREGETVEI